jgi:hypothetical protein
VLDKAVVWMAVWSGTQVHGALPEEAESCGSWHGGAPCMDVGPGDACRCKLLV